MRWGLGRTALVLAWVVGGACSLPRSPVVHQGLEQSPPAPVGSPVNPWVRPDDLSAGASPDPSADPCGPRSGVRPDGECERLRAEAWGHGERVLLPKGKVILGGVPQSYLGGPNAQGNPKIRYHHNALHRVAVDSFWVDVVEVQRWDYQDCVKAGQCSAARCAAPTRNANQEGVPTQFQGEGESVLRGLPQTCVSYAQAQDYCRFRQGKLPSLAQWTYAARGPELRTYSWGSVFDDAISLGPVPVRLQNDVSFFGMLGMTGGAREIMAGTPELDGGLSPWLEGSFRQKSGPYRSHFERWTKRFACPNTSINARCRATERSVRHLITGFGIDNMSWVWDGAAKDPALDRGPNLEAPLSLPHADIGFRCVYPKKKEDPEFTLPREPLEPPEFLASETLNLFVGVAEAVNLAEARAFCRTVRLIADKGRADAGAWKLPSKSELLLVQAHRLGPGPLWTQEGKAVRAVLNKDGSVQRWEEVAADPRKSAILARCVR